MAKLSYTINDVLQAGCNLEPLHCLNCGSLEVIFDQGVGDAICQDCCAWQSEPENWDITERNRFLYPGQYVQVVKPLDGFPCWQGVFATILGRQLPNSPYYPAKITLPTGTIKQVLLERSEVHVC